MVFSCNIVKIPIVFSGRKTASPAFLSLALRTARTVKKQHPAFREGYKKGKGSCALDCFLFHWWDNQNYEIMVIKVRRNSTGIKRNSATGRAG
jgi:hypothetical protein